MKIKKLFAVVATLFIVCSSTFAFDGNTFWKEYGGGLKNGDSLVHVGVGLNTGIFGGDFKYVIPPINASYERMVHINDTLPFSFGGFASVYGWGIEMPDGYDYTTMSFKYKTISFTNIGAAATAKYHFNFGIKNLDVYAGFMAGVSIVFADTTGAGFLWGTNLGATWFFTDKIAASVDLGYPYLLNAKFTMKF